MSNWWGRIGNWIGNTMSTIAGPSGSQLHDSRVVHTVRLPRLSPKDMYELLESYYANNRLYDDRSRLLKSQGISHAAIKGLRNPVHAVIEFYASVLWP